MKNNNSTYIATDKNTVEATRHPNQNEISYTQNHIFT